MRKLLSNKWIYYIEKHRITNSVTKMTFFAHGGISIKLFVVYLRIINECLSYKFHPYSILTGHTKVESVAYQVLSHHLTWHCSRIYEDLQRFTRNLQHMSAELCLLLFLNNLWCATCKNNNKHNSVLISCKLLVNLCKSS